MISNAELAKRGRELLAQAARERIPYVANCGNMSGMDCQGLIEYLMGLCGVERNWKGSNDMWRNALKWAGTPEAFMDRFGELPEGAGVFIVANDGGEPDEYKRTDGNRFGGSKGNANHVGLWLGGGSVIHASASQGCVCESVRFNGRDAVPNGGWNMVGLWADVDYGAELEAAVEGDMPVYDDASGGSDNAMGGSDNASGGGASQSAATSYATVFASDGGAVKLRPQPKKDKLWWEVASGARVSVERTKGGWALIRAVCTDGVSRRAWMMSDFLIFEG